MTVCHTSKVELLNLGANDYLVKPYNHDELLARVAIQLRVPASIEMPQDAECLVQRLLPDLLPNHADFFGSPESCVENMTVVNW